jgi:hypothetical protein
MEATKILAGFGPTALEFEGEKLEAHELEVMIVLRLSKLMGFITLHCSALSNQICDTQHVALQSSKGIMNHDCFQNQTVKKKLKWLEGS